MDEGDGFWFPTPPHLKRTRGLRKRQVDARTRPVEQCRYPDCPNDKRRVQGAAYCEEHAKMKAGIWQTGYVRAVIAMTCARCGFEWSQTRTAWQTLLLPQRAAWNAFCQACKDATPLELKALLFHRVPPDMIIGWLMQGGDLRCGLCDRGFTDAVSPSIDHDHGCCGGHRSCGLCIRGVVCVGCNTENGMIEKVVREDRLARHLAWIGPTSPRELTLVRPSAESETIEPIKKPRFLGQRGS